MMTLAYSSFDIISFHGNYKQLVYSLNLLHVIVHQVSAFDQKNVMNFLFKNPSDQEYIQKALFVIMCYILSK